MPSRSALVAQEAVEPEDVLPEPAEDEIGAVPAQAGTCGDPAPSKLASPPGSIPSRLPTCAG